MSDSEKSSGSGVGLEKEKADVYIPEPGESLEVELLGSFQKAAFDDVYRLDKRINSGTYGVVFETSHRKYPNNKSYAVKVLDRLFHKHNDHAVIREVSILRELRNVPHVVEMIDFYADAEKMYIVQGLALGGDVFERLVNREVYTEKNAHDLSEILLEVISHLHDKNIVHRDLKPENLLLRDVHDDTSILLCDFGVSTYLREEGLKTKCGTPAFVAPELLLGRRYHEKVDMWSIGCLIYMLVGGYQPFQGETEQKMVQKIRAGDFVFHDRYWENVHIEVKQLIAKLLTVNPQYRCSAKDSLQTDWIHKIKPDELQGRNLNSALREFKKFNARRRLKGCMTAVRIASSFKVFKTKLASFSRAKIIKTDSSGVSSFKSDKQSSARSIHSLEDRGSFFACYEFADNDDDDDIDISQQQHQSIISCYHRKSNAKFACKIYLRTGHGDDDEDVMNEVAILQTLSIHDKYIVPLTDFFEAVDKFYAVLEYEEDGGDLYDRLEQKGVYDEYDAKHVIRNLLLAVQHMHSNGVAHRDIKPQNLLFDSADDDLKGRLSGFRFAKRVHTPQSLTHRVGTPIYVSPEVLKNIPHDERVDMWTIGIITYLLLVGYPPFMEESQSILFQKIRTGSFMFDDESWDEVTTEGMTFISNLLIVNPVERWSVSDALEHDWIKSLEIEEQRERERRFKEAMESSQQMLGLEEQQQTNATRLNEILELEDENEDDVDEDELQISVKKDNLIVDKNNEIKRIESCNSLNSIGLHDLYIDTASTTSKEEQKTQLRGCLTAESLDALPNGNIHSTSISSLKLRNPKQYPSKLRMHSKTVMWSNENIEEVPREVE